MKSFYYKEWKDAEKEGNGHYAQLCKLKYMCLMMKARKETQRQYIYILEQWTQVNLN